MDAGQECNRTGTLCAASDVLGPLGKYPRHDKLRLAYFSPDFKEHPVSLLSAQMYELHDRERFEVIAFSLSAQSDDAMGQRLRGSFDRFIDAHEMSDQQVASLARSMQIDIAVDLAGFTRNSRPAVFAMRAAPLQLGYLGYLGTLAAPYIDYLIADEVIIPEALALHYSEKIICLPSYQVNDAARPISDRVFTRAELGLPDTGFVFACFNNSYKITPTVFSSWMRILQQVSGSVLLLYAETGAAREQLKAQAAARGIDPARIVFASRLPIAQYLARYRAVDLVLDTFPYNAGTTASDALWAGTPLLTLCGQSFASRVAASVLHAIEVPELITHTAAQYEATAARLAHQPEQLKAIQDRIIANRLTAPLFDCAQFTRYIESAYTRIYARHDADLPPDSC